MKTLDLIAKILSCIFYPLFMPTIGMVLLCHAYHTQIMPLSSLWIATTIGCTILLSCILPLTAIFILIRRGSITDIHISNPRQRTTPYLYSIVGFAFWLYMLIFTIKAPLCINVVALGAVVALCAVTIINYWWKISAHLTGMGGLFGGILSYCLSIQAFPTWGTLCIWLGLTIMLMYARIYLKAHTPTQVIAGWLLGLCCTLIPNIIIYYAIV